MDGAKAGPGSSPSTPPAMGIYYPQSNSFKGLSSYLPSYMGVMWNSAYSNGNVILQATCSSNGNPMIVDLNLTSGDYYNFMDAFPAGLNSYLLGENSQGFYIGGDSYNLKQYLSFYDFSSGKIANMTDDISGNSVHLSALYSSGNLLYLAYKDRSGNSFIEAINALEAIPKSTYKTYTEVKLNSEYLRHSYYIEFDISNKAIEKTLSNIIVPSEFSALDVSRMLSKFIINPSEYNIYNLSVYTSSNSKITDKTLEQSIVYNALLWASMYSNHNIINSEYGQTSVEYKNLSVLQESDGIDKATILGSDFFKICISDWTVDWRCSLLFRWKPDAEYNY